MENAKLNCMLAQAFGGFLTKSIILACPERLFLASAPYSAAPDSQHCGAPIIVTQRQVNRQWE